MQFTRLHSIILISLVLFCLAGLTFIQLSWLKGAKSIREAELEDQLHITFEQIQTALNQRLAAPHTSIPWVTQHTVDSILSLNRLSMPYEFGISSCKTKQFNWFSKPEMEEQIREGYQAQLSKCIFFNQANKADHLHFYMIFPQREVLIFRQMATAIGSSIFFILLLILAFIYLLSTIFRQKKLSEMKSDFINNLTHEFKTPIASIALAANTLKKLDVVHQSPKALNYLQLINQEGKRLENHIDKVLQMASMDSGTVQLEMLSVEPNKIIKKVVNSLQVMLDQQNGSIELDLHQVPIFITADPMHFFNMVYNLIDNAIKYNNDPVFIHVTSTVKNGFWELYIQDNGIGMSKEVQNQIFQRFYRQNQGDVHDVKGFGLGLAYVKRMAEAHGAEVKLESQLGHGTTFRLIFPQHDNEDYV
ncbi:MAG: HAMP domain-containing sensor histidine kinase [Bacteroidota bacterium]